MTVRRVESVRNIFDFVMYYIYGQSGPSLVYRLYNAILFGKSYCYHLDILVPIRTIIMFQVTNKLSCRTLRLDL